MIHTGLGERRPHPGAHWLQALIGLEQARIWWAPAPAVGDYEAALRGAFAATIPAADRAALHDASVILPFANLRTVTGERKRTGLSTSLAPATRGPATPAGRVVQVPPGAALGTGGLPGSSARTAGGTIRRAARPAAATGARSTCAPRAS